MSGTRRLTTASASTCLHCSDRRLWGLQQSVANQARPPLPALLSVLKEGLKVYEARRATLLDEDTELRRDADPIALHEECPDKHEKCPLWASIVSIEQLSGSTDSKSLSCVHEDVLQLGGASATSVEAAYLRHIPLEVMQMHQARQL